MTREPTEEVHAYGDTPDSQPVPLPPEFDWVSLTPVESSTYRNLRMLRGDLDFAIVVLTGLVDTRVGTESRSGDRDLARDDHRARWNAALVAYARTFLSGVGERLTPDIFDANGADAHSYFIGLRNRHVAHSVSEYEEAGVLISLLRDHPATVEGLLDYLTTEQSPGHFKVRELLRLAHVAREHVERRLQTERKTLLEYARANVSDLAKRERLTSTPESQFDDDVRPRKSERQ